MNKYEANRNTVVKTIRFTKEELNKIDLMRGERSFSEFMKSSATALPCIDDLVQKAGEAFLDVSFNGNDMMFSSEEKMFDALIAMSVFYNEACARRLIEPLHGDFVNNQEKSDD